ncbi:MAG: ABC transporter substrate-binding protein [Acidimicrobiia bacterium]
MKKTTSAVVVAVLALLSACGGDDDDAAPIDTTPSSDEVAPTSTATTPATSEATTPAPTETTTPVVATTAPLEPRPLTVSSLGICNELPLAWGVAKGLFEEHAIDIEVVKLQGGGAAAIAALQSGDLDVAFAAGVPVISAIAAGIPLTFVAGHYYSSPREGAIGVAADSSITQVTDLAGKIIAVNELGGYNQMLVSAWLEENGVSADDVSFVALPFADTPGAITGGQVDAGLLTAAQTVSAGDNAISVVGYSTEAQKPLPTGMFSANSDFVADNEALLADFHAALSESVAQITEPANREDAIAVQSEFCGTPVEVLSTIDSSVYDADVYIDRLRTTVDLMVQFDMLEDAVEIEPFIAAFAAV